MALRPSLSGGSLLALSASYRSALLTYNWAVRDMHLREGVGNLTWVPSSRLALVRSGSFALRRPEASCVPRRDRLSLMDDFPESAKESSLYPPAMGTVQEAVVAVAG